MPETITALPSSYERTRVCGQALLRTNATNILAQTLRGDLVPLLRAGLTTTLRTYQVNFDGWIVVDTAGAPAIEWLHLDEAPQLPDFRFDQVGPVS